MPLETASFITDLVASNPALGDPVGQGDDHMRLIKAVLKATFPNLNAAVTATPGDLNTVTGGLNSLTAAVNGEIAARAAAVASEANARSAAITAEASTRSAQDGNLFADYTTRDAALQTDYIARDVGLQSQINTITGTTIPTLMPFGSIQFAGAGNGVYAHIPNNVGTSFIIQAGYTGALPTGNGDSVPFPIPFPQATMAVIVSNATPGNLTVSGTLPGGAAAASGFLAYAKTASSGAAAPGAAVYFIAMGF